MMKKGMSFNKLASVALAIFMLISFYGCTDPAEGPLKEVDAEVWTLPSTVKVLRDEDYSEHYTDNPALSIELARNEYESAQLFITPEQDVDFYELVSADLTAADGGRISKENIEIHNQWYTEVTALTKPTSGRPLGYYPDALIPSEYSKAAGENNIKAGANQGIYITVYASKTTNPGVYTGVFTLKLDDTVINIPVSVTVWDFIITDEVHAGSTFNLFPEYIMGGELDNTPEMYEKYVDYLLEYRISTTDIVYPTDISMEDWVEKIKKYAADVRVTSYNIGGVYSEIEELTALIEASTPELNLLEKAFVYLIDEPDASILDRVAEEYYQLVDDIIALSNSYTSEQLASFGLTKDDINGIEILITLTASHLTIDGLRTYCAVASDFDTEAYRQKYDDFSDNFYKGANNELEGKDFGTTWWYVCVHPFEPHPTYVMDTDLLYCRVASWMQYDYDLKGMLYWGSASYFDTDGMYDTIIGWKPADIYNGANVVYPGANGDGYVLYPGAKYGVAGPLPSIRLMNIRDGFEDYEYIYMLEELSAQYAQKFGISNFNFDSVMRSIYDGLYTGTVADTDYIKVLDARRTLAQMIELLSNDAHAIVVTNDYNYERNSISVDIYAESGAYLLIDGTEVHGAASGSGTRITCEIVLNKDKNYFNASLVYNGKTQSITKMLSTKIKNVSVFSSDADVNAYSASTRPGGGSHINISRNTVTDYVSTGNSSMKVFIGSKSWTNWEYANYLPYVEVSKQNFFGADELSDIDYIELMVYNGSDSEVTMYFGLKSQASGSQARTSNFKTITLVKGWNKVRISDVSKITWRSGNNNLLDSLTGVLFQFQLSDNDITIYFDSIAYAYKID